MRPAGEVRRGFLLKLKIGLVLERFDPARGGLEHWTHQFAIELVRRGHQVHVVAFEFHPGAREDGIIPHQLAMPRSRIERGEAIAAHLPSLELDVVHDMGIGWHADIIHPHGGSTQALWEHNLLRIPKWRQIRFWRERRYRELAEIERRQLFESKALIVPVSRMVKQHFEVLHRLPAARMRVIHNGVDVKRFTPESRHSLRPPTRQELGLNEEVLFLMLAHNLLLKNAEAPIRAAARLKAAGAPVRVLIAGGRKSESFVRLAEKLGLRDVVSFLGLVDPIPYYAAADVFVHPTWYDPCSLVTLEAASCGLPVITSRYNGASELMVDGKDGFILENPADVATLASRMRGSAASGNARADGSRRARDGERKYLRAPNDTVSGALPGNRRRTLMLSALDSALFHFLNGSLRNPVFDVVMPFLSAPPPGFRLAFLLGAVIFAWKGGQRAWSCLAALVLVLILGEALVYSPLKNLLGRPRPYEVLADVHLLVGRGSQPSMPSSHAGNCFAAAIICGFYYRRSVPWLFAVACAVGFARVYTGAHYPGDVLLGALLGSGVGIAVLWGMETARRRFSSRVSAELSDAQWLRLGYLLIAFTLLANLIYIASGRIELCEDEAYQWLWSKHPDWGYYSKPPLIAWVQFVGTHLWGDNELGVRFFSPLCGAVAGWLLLRLLAREINGRIGFLALLIATATPLLAGSAILFVPDSLAILFWMAALVSGWQALRGDSTRAWLWTGLWMGLGLLSKQVALYQWLCWLVFFALHPAARPQLRRAGFYLALLISCLGAVPLIFWNAQHQWPTVAHLQSRSGLGSSWQPTLRFFGEFIVAEMGLLTPIFCIGIVVAMIKFWPRRHKSPLALYLFCMSAPLLAGCLLYSIRTRVQPNWIAPAALPAVALMALTLEARRKWLTAGIVFGLAVIVLGHETRLIEEITGYSLPPKLDPLRRVRGWNSAAETVEIERHRLTNEGKPSFVIGDHYGITSLLTFYTPTAKAAAAENSGIYCLATDEPANQFSFWPGYSARQGESAIFVQKTDEPHPPPPRLHRQFESVTDLGMRRVYDDHGMVIRRIQLFACRKLR